MYQETQLSVMKRGYKPHRLIKIRLIGNHFPVHPVHPLLSPFVEASSHAPDAIQNAAILKNPQQLVICGDLVEIGSFLICEE